MKSYGGCDKYEPFLQLFTFEPHELHLIDQQVIMLIHKGGIEIVKNRANILQVFGGREVSQGGMKGCLKWEFSKTTG